MMGIINGIERTPWQFYELAEEAGLRVEKIWECRSQVSIVECRAVFAPEGEGRDILGMKGENLDEIESRKVAGGADLD